MNNNYLMHHGIQGMKWGVRRYQNEDGTLTNAGKRRYESDGKGGYKLASGRSIREMTADRIANDLEKMKGTSRMASMSSRQKESYKKANQYWNDRASGKNTIHRGVIRRVTDRQRSFNFEERASSAYVKSVTDNIVNQRKQQKLSEILGQEAPKIKVGGAIVNGALGAAMSLGLDEITNKAFGHF